MFLRRGRPFSLTGCAIAAVIALIALTLRSWWPDLSGEAKQAHRQLHNLVWSADVAEADRAFLRNAFEEAQEPARAAAREMPQRRTTSRRGYRDPFDEHVYRMHALQLIAGAAEEANRTALAKSMQELLAQEMGERTVRR